MFACIPCRVIMDAFFFFRCKFHLLSYSRLNFFLYFSTVRMICMFQSSRGFKRRALSCCLQEVDISVHTFLYV